MRHLKRIVKKKKLTNTSYFCNFHYSRKESCLSLVMLNEMITLKGTTLVDMVNREIKRGSGQTDNSS